MMVGFHEESSDIRKKSMPSCEYSGASNWRNTSHVKSSARCIPPILLPKIISQFRGARMNICLSKSTDAPGYLPVYFNCLPLLLHKSLLSHPTIIKNLLLNQHLDGLDLSYLCRYRHGYKKRNKGYTYDGSYKVNRRYAYTALFYTTEGQTCA